MITNGFVAVLRTGSAADCGPLSAAGAKAVLTWSELGAGDALDDLPAVLLDGPQAEVVPALLAALDRAALDRAALDRAALDRAAGSADAGPDIVIATIRPVVDTLKLVAGDGELTGTAERETHRFVGTPIAARLRVLRAAARELRDPVPAGAGPTGVSILRVLRNRGAIVLGEPAESFRDRPPPVS